MTTRLKLICHASTSAARASAFPADEPLDAQARRKLGDAPHQTHFADRFLTSPALRAVQTCEALKIAATVEPMLRECDYGRWAGRSLDEVQAREPDAVAEWFGDPSAAPHGGESLLALMERIALWLDAQKSTPGKVVAVTHASVIRAAIVHVLGAGPQSYGRIDVAPLSRARLSAHDGRWTFAALEAYSARASRP